MLTRQPGWFVWSWERAVGWPSHTQYPGNSTRTSTRGEASLCWCTPLPQLAMGRPPGPAATLLLTSPPHTAHLHACARTHTALSPSSPGVCQTPVRGQVGTQSICYAQRLSTAWSAYGALTHLRGPRRNRPTFTRFTKGNLGRGRSLQLV